MEERELDLDGVAVRSTDLPLAACLDWVFVWVTRRLERLEAGGSL